MTVALKDIPMLLAIGLILSAVGTAVLLAGLYLILRRSNEPETYFIVGGILLVMASLVARGSYFVS